MKVYQLVRSIGYTKNILDHFDITLFNTETDHFITVSRPTADEYVQLCGRDVMEWMPLDADLNGRTDGIDITVPMENWDIETFKE